MWELLTDCEEKECDMDVKHVKALRTGEAKKAMTKEPMLFMEGNEKADEMAKEGADVDGGHMAAGKALGHQCVNVCCAFSCAGRRERQR